MSDLEQRINAIRELYLAQKNTDEYVIGASREQHIEQRKDKEQDQYADHPATKYMFDKR